MLKNILIFTAGAIVGALTMHLYVVNTQDEYELTPEEQEEIDDCKATLGAIINKTNDEIINHDLFTNKERSQRMYELFCEAHNDWVNSRIFRKQK